MPKISEIFESSDPLNQLKLGLVEWFSDDKGYGVAICPEIGEVFLHKSNFLENKLTPKYGMALFFEVKKQHGKESGVNIRIPASLMEIESSTENLKQNDNLYVILRNKRNKFKYNVKNIAIIQTIHKINKNDLENYLKTIVIDKGYEGIIKFSTLLLVNLKSSNSEEKKKTYLFALNLLFQNVPRNLKFDIWKTLLDKYCDVSIDQYMDEKEYVSYELPFSLKDLDIEHDLIVSNIDKIVPDNFLCIYDNEIADKDYNIQDLIEKIRNNYEAYNLNNVKWVVALMFVSFRVYEQAKHDEFSCWLINHVDDSVIISLCTEIINYGDSLIFLKYYNPPFELIRPTILFEEIIIRVNSLLASCGNEKFLNIIYNLSTKIDEVKYSRLVDKLNKQISIDKIFELWQLKFGREAKRYFNPDIRFFDRHIEELSINDVKEAPLDWQKKYHFKKAENILSGNNINQLFELAVYCKNLSNDIIQDIVNLISPTERRFALIFAFFSDTDFERYYFEESESVGNSIFNILKEYKSYYKFLSEYTRLIHVSSSINEDYLEFDYGRVIENYGIGEKLISKCIKHICNIGKAEILFLILSQLKVYKISLEEIVHIIDISSLAEIEKRKVFDRAYYNLENQQKFLLWLDRKTSLIDFDILVSNFRLLDYNKQIKTLRRLFLSFVKEETVFDINLLMSLINENKDVDINVQIVVNTLNKLSKVNKFLTNVELSDIIASYVGEKVELLLKINELFEVCPGRATLAKNSIANHSWYAIIEGEKYSVNGDYIEIGDHFVPFDRVSRTVGIDGTQYHFSWDKVGNVDKDGFQIERKDIPNGITFCEGQRSIIKDDRSGREFYWCSNKPCFSPVQNPHHYLLWEKYTLQDFIHILNLPFDKEDYFKFLALLNRTNNLLERLKCHSCGHILRPIKSSNFAFYRVTTFHCTNINCEKHEEKIYLSHCLNWKCNGIIDSRVSTQCPNDWYICEECGSCCSHEKLTQRLKNLKKAGAFNPFDKKHQKLLKQVKEHLGHEELGMKFDYRTGELLDHNY